MGSPVGDSPWARAQCFLLHQLNMIFLRAEHVHVMHFFLGLFVFFNCFSLTLEVIVPDDSDDEFAYEEVRFFLFGYIS